MRRTLAALALTATALTTVTVVSADDVLVQPADTAWGAPATDNDTAWGTPPDTGAGAAATPLDTAWG
jgi:hypothetical protein